MLARIWRIYLKIQGWEKEVVGRKGTITIRWKTWWVQSKYKVQSGLMWINKKREVLLRDYLGNIKLATNISAEHLLSNVKKRVRRGKLAQGKLTHACAPRLLKPVRAYIWMKIRIRNHIILPFLPRSPFNLHIYINTHTHTHTLSLSLSLSLSVSFMKMLHIDLVPRPVGRCFARTITCFSIGTRAK